MRFVIHLSVRFKTAVQLTRFAVDEFCQHKWVEATIVVIGKASLVVPNGITTLDRTDEQHYSNC